MTALATDDLYETDIAAWSRQQVDALRRLAQASPPNAVDWKNLIEEIESVGRSQVSGVERRLGLVIAHSIKVLSAPDSPALRGWRSEIESHQRVLRKQFGNSMRQLIDWEEVWSDACDEARTSLAEWGDSIVRGLPARNPLVLDDLLSREFNVDLVLARIVDALAAPRA